MLLCILLRGILTPKGWGLFSTIKYVYTCERSGRRICFVLFSTHEINYNTIVSSLRRTVEAVDCDRGATVFNPQTQTLDVDPTKGDCKHTTTPARAV